MIKLSTARSRFRSFPLPGWRMLRARLDRRRIDDVALGLLIGVLLLCAAALITATLTTATMGVPYLPPTLALSIFLIVLTANAVLQLRIRKSAADLARLLLLPDALCLFAIAMALRDVF